ncbi:MAG: class I SAM-dependent methyltransferase [Xanthomonadales bacterium]|nr:class I SAM-dependent methyltransferase [Xanthomonadales bacterium]
MTSQFTNYQSFWNDKASTVTGAMIAVDGSADEATLEATGRYSARQVRHALELAPGDHVLELGCGVGRIGSHLAPDCTLWHGVDIAPRMIEVARDRLSGLPDGRVRLDALDRTRLAPCADAAYDKAYCVAVFIHMDKEDFLIYLRELFRVLKPGGRLFFDHWNLAHPVGFQRFEAEVAQYVDFDQSARKDVARNQFTCPQEVELFLQAAGFELALLEAGAPFLQAVAVKPGGEAAGQVGERLRRDLARIQYGPRWTQWFGGLFPMFYGDEHPAALLARMPAADSDEESAMHHLWVRAIWRNHPDRWGPVTD